jgi:hypothetical protein
MAFWIHYVVDVVGSREFVDFLLEQGSLNMLHRSACLSVALVLKDSSQRGSCMRRVGGGLGWKGLWWHWMKRHLGEPAILGDEETVE